MSDSFQPVDKRGAIKYSKNKINEASINRQIQLLLRNQTETNEQIKELKEQIGTTQLHFEERTSKELQRLVKIIYLEGTKLEKKIESKFSAINKLHLQQSNIGISPDIFRGQFTVPQREILDHLMLDCPELRQTRNGFEKYFKNARLANPTHFRGNGEYAWILETWVKQGLLTNQTSDSERPKIHYSPNLDNQDMLAILGNYGRLELCLDEQIEADKTPNVEISTLSRRNNVVIRDGITDDHKCTANDRVFKEGEDLLIKIKLKDLGWREIQVHLVTHNKQNFEKPFEVHIKMDELKAV